MTDNTGTLIAIGFTGTALGLTKDAVAKGNEALQYLEERGLVIVLRNQWQPIETAPKEPDSTGLVPRILLGFAPDEENHTLPSCEGFWLAEPYKEREPCFVSSLDPGIPFTPPQPTHWQPLPEPPEDG